MKEKPYVCNICKRRFSRKSNAFRHNSTIHYDLGTIERDSLQYLKDKPRPNNHANDFRQIHRFNSKYKRRKEIDLNQDIFFGDIPDKTDNLKIYKILGQLIKPYLALEKELDHMNPIYVPKILSDSFFSSLESYNPVKSLSEIAELYRSMRALDIIATNMHKSKGVLKEVAMANIKESIRNCSLYGRINN